MNESFDSLLSYSLLSLPVLPVFFYFWVTTEAPSCCFASVSFWTLYTSAPLGLPVCSPDERETGGGREKERYGWKEGARENRRESGPSSTAFPVSLSGNSGSGTSEQPGFKLALIWDANFPNCGFTCYTMVPVPPPYFLHEQTWANICLLAWLGSILPSQVWVSLQTGSSHYSPPFGFQFCLSAPKELKVSLPRIFETNIWLKVCSVVCCFQILLLNVFWGLSDTWF